MVERAAITQAVAHHLPGRTIIAIQDRGVWLRRILEITLDDGEVVFLKMRADPQWGDLVEKEAFVCRLLQAQGLPAPRVYALDRSGTILEEPFLIQEGVGGRRLGHWLETAPAETEQIYYTLGQFYRRLHAVRHTHSGWITGLGDVLTFSPNDYMFQKVIIEHGQTAVARDL
jgi:aminoglycoside phosphotransferase